MTPFLTTCLNRLGDYFVNVRLVNDVGGESPRSSNVTWGPWKKGTTPLCFKVSYENVTTRRIKGNTQLIIVFIY